ncbi:hypothetical protein [Billgrantia gudaonensis]|uniref:Lipoprotein n=1 Tax=Billgrantia gudaonensis TaxID=376427 RepID=A0A1G8SZQ3_9GAMM|nr:hypothetical protein [Halomonas gudaonensis]SDJ34275.1 hypothetical protein SAMN04487954_104140 [Halomonas gudaonensis]
MLSRTKLAGISASCLLLSGCSATMMGTNLVPERNEFAALDHAPTVTYQLPNAIEDIERLGLESIERLQGSQSNRRALGIKVEDAPEADQLTVTAYEQNISSAGMRLSRSINEYRVAYQIEGETVTLTPTESRTHQDGLVLPIPVPEFSPQDVATFLSTIKGTLQVTAESPFPAEAINANFRRLMDREAYGRFRSNGDERTFRNVYFTEVEGADVRLKVDVYPYRDGTQADIEATYYTKGDGTAPIVIEEIEERISDAVSDVVNA